MHTGYCYTHAYNVREIKVDFLKKNIFDQVEIYLAVFKMS